MVKSSSWCCFVLFQCWRVGSVLPRKQLLYLLWPGTAAVLPTTSQNVCTEYTRWESCSVIEALARGWPFVVIVILLFFRGEPVGQWGGGWGAFSVRQHKCMRSAYMCVCVCLRWCVCVCGCTDTWKPVNMCERVGACMRVQATLWVRDVCISMCVSFTLFCVTKYVLVLYYYAFDFCASIYAFHTLL